MQIVLRSLPTNGYAHLQCFLSIPAWIYLIGAPRYPRTRKFAEPHAMVCVDSLFTILWLSAFAAQASSNTANRCGTACGQSKAIVGLGIFVTYVLQLERLAHHAPLFPFPCSPGPPTHTKLTPHTLASSSV